MIGKKQYKPKETCLIYNDIITPPLRESARQERSSQARRWGNIQRQNNLKFSRELRQNTSFGIGGYL